MDEKSGTDQIQGGEMKDRFTAGSGEIMLSLFPVGNMHFMLDLMKNLKA